MITDYVVPSAAVKQSTIPQCCRRLLSRHDNQTQLSAQQVYTAHVTWQVYTPHSWYNC